MRRTKVSKTIAVMDKGTYPKSIKVSDKELDNVNLYKNHFHGDWNYIISPHTK